MIFQVFLANKRPDFFLSYSQRACFQNCLGSISELTELKGSKCYYCCSRLLIFPLHWCPPLPSCLHFIIWKACKIYRKHRNPGRCRENIFSQKLPNQCPNTTFHPQHFIKIIFSSERSLKANSFSLNEIKVDRKKWKLFLLQGIILNKVQNTVYT